MALLRRKFAYTKIEAEDTDELKHRKAQFLICKMLERADAMSRPRHSFLRIRLFRIKVKIGKRLKKPRKRVAGMLTVASVGLIKKFTRQFKYLEALIC